MKASKQNDEDLFQAARKIESAYDTRLMLAPRAPSFSSIRS